MMALFGIDQLQEELDILSSKHYYRYVFVIGILTVSLNKTICDEFHRWLVIRLTGGKNDFN